MKQVSKWYSSCSCSSLSLSLYRKKLQRKLQKLKGNILYVLTYIEVFGCVLSSSSCCAQRRDNWAMKKLKLQSRTLSNWHSRAHSCWKKRYTPRCTSYNVVMIVFGTVRENDGCLLWTTGRAEEGDATACGDYHSWPPERQGGQTEATGDEATNRLSREAWTGIAIMTHPVHILQ